MSRYVEILFRYKIRFAFLLIALPAVVGAATILLFPSYRAYAQLWVDSPSYFGGATPSGWSQYLSPAQNESDSFSQVMGTRAFGNELNHQLTNSIPDPKERQSAVTGAKVTVYATGTHLMAISEACERPRTCALVLNTAVAVLREQQSTSDKTQAQEGADYLNAQLQKARPTLSASEDALRRYLAAHPAARVDVDPAFITDPELARLALDVQQQRNRVSDMTSQLAKDETVIASPTAVVTSGLRVVDPPLTTRDGSSLRKAALSGAASLALGLGYLFLLGWVDKTLRDPREIEHRFKVPIVTSIPELQPSERF